MLTVAHLSLYYSSIPFCYLRLFTSFFFLVFLPLQFSFCCVGDILLLLFKHSYMGFEIFEPCHSLL